MPTFRDYSLAGPESDLAVKKGLASGQWFLPQVDRSTMRRLMQRDDYHALRDTAILFSIIFSSGYVSLHYWQAERMYHFALFFWIYCTFYTSSADSRWHECGHSTAFKTKWMNDVLYNIASFMVFREPLVWRFSHARHHTDTDIVGRDPEVDARPLDMCAYPLTLCTASVGCLEDSHRQVAHELELARPTSALPKHGQMKPRVPLHDWQVESLPRVLQCSRDTS